MKTLVMAVVAVVAGVSCSRAASGTWTGAAGNAWAVDGNWSAAPFPQGDETATFAAAGAGTVDVSGLPDILSLVFSGPSFTLGQTGQTLTWRNGGTITLASGASAQAVAANVTLGHASDEAMLDITNNSAAPLSFLGDVTAQAGGVKTLRLHGTGDVEISGNLSKGAASGLDVLVDGTGTLRLGGADNLVRQINMNGPAGGVLDIGAGSLRFEHGGNVNLRSLNSATIDGTGAITFSGGAGDDGADNGAIRADAVLTINVKLTGPAGFEYWIGNNDAAGTVVFNAINDFAGNIALNSAGTISANIVGNQGSTTSNLGKGQKIVFNGNGTGSGLRYTGTGETTDRLMDIPKSARFEMAGTGRLVFATPFSVRGGAGSVIYLSGETAGVGEIAGPVSDGGGAYSVQKSGSGTWVLSARNAFSGALTVAGGTLVLANTNAVGGTVNVSNSARLVLEDAGRLPDVAAFALSNWGVLELRNTAAANVPDRVDAAAALSLQSGTLAVTHDAAAATDYLAEVGNVTLSGGANTIQAAAAAAGQHGTLRMGWLIPTGGTVNFVGEDLGEDDRNRIFIAGMPEGLIGTWAFVNGSQLAAYDSVRGVYAVSDSDFTYTDIAAWGDIIPDDAAANVRIATHGAGAEDELENTVTSVTRLLHDTDTNAVVAMAGKTLQTSAVGLAGGAWPLTLGLAAGDGILTALPGGTLLSLDNASAAALHVNAGIADNGVPLTVVKLGTGPVRLSGALGHTGETLLLGDGLAVDTEGDAVLSGTVSGQGAWSKAGSGTLRLDAANAFTGTFTVSGGTVIPGHNSAFGDPAGTVIVEDGAAIDLGNDMAQNVLILNKMFVISGFGPDGNGAVVHTSGNTQYNTFGKVTLAGDTGFGGPVRWDFRSNTPTLTLDGHTLHKRSANEISLVGTAVNPDRADETKGHIDIEAGMLTLESGTALNGGSGNTITVRDGATLHFWAHNIPSYWSIIMKDGAAFGAGSGGGGTQNTWRGPVEIEGDAWFTRNAIKTVESGITGAGSLWHLDGTTYLKGTNTYAGTTTVSNGHLHACTPYALPGWEGGRVTGASGTMVLHAGDGENGWTKAQILAYKDAATMMTPHWFGVDTTQLNLDMDAPIDGTFSFVKFGEGYMTLHDGLDITGLLSVVGARNSVLTLAPATSNACTGVNVTGQADPATLNVDGPLYMDKSGPAQRVQVSNNAGGRSYMNINADLETGQFLVGVASNAFAAVVQNSGHVQSAPDHGSSEVFSVGAHNFGYGYYRMNGGTLDGGQISVTGNNTGTGVLEMFGGEISATAGWFLTCWGGGNGIVNLYDGKLGVYPTGNRGINLTDAGDRGSFSMVNLLGAGAVFDAGLRTTAFSGVEMAKLGGNALSAINLNAGTMIAKRIFASTPTTPTFLNFGGGTLAADANGLLLNGSLTAATVYDGGAAIDTGANDVIVVQPLLAPEGSGVSEVTLAAPGANYMGPPVVKLTGGSGTGAMAVAAIDFSAGSPAFGQLTGITVTAPGTGYQPEDTLTAELVSGGGAGASASAVTLAPHAQAGGLTKRGTGTLTLAAPCTYKGPTRIAEGTLRISGDNNGLFEGMVANAAGANMNAATPNPMTAIQPGTRMAHVAANATAAETGVPYWPDYVTYIYTGYVWNNTDDTATWSFVKHFDDSIRLVIDGNVVMEHGVWSEAVRATYALTPGPHPFEVRFGQGGGGVGPVGGSIGFGYDPLGRDLGAIDNYLPMTDPGNGSLFTLTASDEPFDALLPSSSVIVDTGATLDLGGNNVTLLDLSGGGQVINGALALTGDLMPGGNGALGTLTLAADLALTATYHADVLPDGASDLVIVNGNADISQMALRIVDPGLLSKGKSHTILTTTGTLTGTFATDNLPPAWRLTYTPNSVKIASLGGTVIILR